MFDDPYLGITKPRPLFESLKIAVDTNKYISIQLYRKRAIDYYEVTFHNENSEIYFGKFYKDDSLIDAKYNNGKILVYTEEFNHKLRKMMISQVLALYDIKDDTFYYCSEKDALILFDNTIEPSGLKKPNNKILRTNVRKRITDEKETEIINFYTVRQTKTELSNELNANTFGKSKIIKFPK